MNQETTTLIRRHKQVVAFKKGPGPAYAFHSKNMQVAEISEDIWNQMPTSEFSNSQVLEIPELSKSAEAMDLNNWSEQSSPVQVLDRSSNKFNLTLNITQLCNLHCHYCAAGGDGTYGDPVRQISVEKTLPQIQMLMKRLKPGGQFNITFLGGEPLMYPGAIKAIGLYTLELAQQSSIEAEFQIITNGTLINDSVLDLIALIKPTITISIDGPPEINDSQRPQKNGSKSSELAVKGLKSLIARKSEFGQLLLHAVFNKNHTDVEKVWDYFQQFEVDKMEFTFDVTEKDQAANLAFTESLKSAAAKAFAKGQEKELRRIQFFDIYFNQLDSQAIRENHCGSGKSLLSLDSRNQIYQCPLEVSFKERMVGSGQELNWNLMKPLEKPLIELNACGTCWARHLCGGGCMFNHESLTGDKHTKHPTYCFRTRHLLSEVFMYYKTLRETE
jgi:uncharacterized protein